MTALRVPENSSFTVFKPETASLKELCDSVLNCTMAYSEIALYIENKAYEEWKNGRTSNAIEQLKRVICFLERPKNRTEPATRELAEVYFLTGQICQYSGLHAESIEWFSKSVFVDDGNSLSYHSIAESYIQTGKINEAARSFERELALNEGNYFTYLELAAIYDRDNNPEKAEECLRKLLARDPDNIQGIHQLIRHYEKNNPAINLKMLTRRILSIKKRYSWIEATIRSCYLQREERDAEAIDFLMLWEENNNESAVIHCAKAWLFTCLKMARQRKKEIARFREICKERQEVMLGYVDEFRNVFGDSAAEKLLAYCFPDKESFRP